MRYKILFLIVALLSAFRADAQTDRQYIRMGNRQFGQGQYAAAETDYRRAIAQNGQNGIAWYNLGCALQRQHKDTAQICRSYRQATQMLRSRLRRAKAFYNLGVAHQTARDYTNAIADYKNALRLNPRDANARYNYVLCNRKQQQQKKQNKSQQQQQKQNKKQKQNNKQRQQQNKNKDKKQNKQNQNQPKPKQQQMSRDNADRLLDAALQQEQQTQQRLQKAMRQPQRKRLKQNW